MRNVRLLLSPWADALSLLLLSLRLINTLKVLRGVGVLVIMLGQMLPQIAMWFVIALCVTVGFSLFLTLLLPGHVALDAAVISWPAYAPEAHTPCPHSRCIQCPVPTDRLALCVPQVRAVLGAARRV